MELARRKLAHRARGRSLRRVGRGMVRRIMRRTTPSQHTAPVSTMARQPSHAMEGDPLMAVDPDPTHHWWRRSHEDADATTLPISEPFTDSEPIPLGVRSP